MWVDVMCVDEVNEHGEVRAGFSRSEPVIPRSYE